MKSTGARFPNELQLLDFGIGLQDGSSRNGYQGNMNVFLSLNMLPALCGLLSIWVEYRLEDYANFV